MVKGRGLTADAWGRLIKELDDVAAKMEASDEDSDSFNVVLETSFNALTTAKKRAFKKMAVLAPSAVASTEMLLNLWETEVRRGFPFAVSLNLWNWFADHGPCVL